MSGTVRDVVHMLYPLILTNYRAIIIINTRLLSQYRD